MPNPEELIKKLNNLSRKLRECENCDSVVTESLKEVCKHLNTQVASIYLFGKNGTIKRIGIHGKDKNGEEIESTWFNEEEYQPGESFSAKSIPRLTEESDFGGVHFSNNIEDEYRPVNAKQYKDKLGYLKSGITVPLNGLNRTFGSVEVLNKKDGKDFTEEDISFLMLIGSLISNFISDFKTKHKQNIYNKITTWLFESQLGKQSVDLQEIYEFLAKILVEPITSYKVCIIRIVNEKGEFEIKAIKGAKGVNLKGRYNDPLKKTDPRIVAETHQKKIPNYIEDLEKEPNRFRNKDWIKANELKSYACLPLIANGEFVGTITLYIGYEHRFYGSNKDFFNNLAFVTASIIATDRNKKRLNKAERELQQKRHSFFITSREVAFDTNMRGFLHQYKNELIEFAHIFSQLGKNTTLSNKQKNRLINDRKEWINRRVEEISAEFREDSDNLDIVNVNQIIKDTAKLFLFDEPDITIKEEDYDDGIPDLELSEAKIKEVISCLIDNAIAAIRRAERKEGKLSLQTKIITLNRIDYIQISVQDNGDGIRNEIKGRIFDQKFTTRRKEGGNGMGLFIARKIIVSDYGGKINFESKVGSGTTFNVYIPLKRYLP